MEIGLSRFNEVFERTNVPREHYGPLFEALERIGAENISDRISTARRRLGELGATFESDDSGDPERLIPVDWMPRILPSDHWQRLSDGLLQRGRAINAWLEALYGKGQDVVPEELVKSSVFYRPHEIPAGSAPVRVPSGVAYSEAIRRAGLDALPELFQPYRVAGIYAYYAAT